VDRDPEISLDGGFTGGGATEESFPINTPTPGKAFSILNGGKTWEERLLVSFRVGGKYGANGYSRRGGGTNATQFFQTKRKGASLNASDGPDVFGMEKKETRRKRGSRKQLWSKKGKKEDVTSSLSVKKNEAVVLGSQKKRENPMNNLCLAKGRRKPGRGK